jgi:hypothetical protein
VEIRDKYPQWLAAKRGELSAEDVARYVSSRTVSVQRAWQGRPACADRPWDRPRAAMAGQDNPAAAACMRRMYAFVRGEGVRALRTALAAAASNRFQRLDRIGGRFAVLRYSKQYELVTEICAAYEADDDRAALTLTPRPSLPVPMPKAHRSLHSSSLTRLSTVSA